MRAQDFARQTPYLRRHARGPTGSQAEGDDFVRAALDAIRDRRVLRETGIPFT